MKTLATKSRTKQRLYARRKHRTNTITKTTSLRPRLIVNRSNTSISAQVIDREGKVVAVANDAKISK